MLRFKTSWSAFSYITLIMIPILLATTLSVADANQHNLPPLDDPSYQVCIDMEHDVRQAVEFDLITTDQMYGILKRCYINYS